MRQLARGWNGYDAPPPSDWSINQARHFHLLAEFGHRLAASAIGGVGCTIRGAKNQVYVEFRNDNSVYAMFTDGTPEPVRITKVDATDEGYGRLLKEIREFI